MGDLDNWLAGDAIVWGTRPKFVQHDNDQWVLAKKQPAQWVGRFLKNPDTGEEAFVFYCRTRREATRIWLQGFVAHNKRFLMDRIKRCTVMSFGLQEDWMRDVCTFPDEMGAKSSPQPYVIPYDYYNEDDVPTRFRGPYGLAFDAPDEDDDEPKIWLNSIGQYVEPGEVNDILVDTTLLSERDFESICEQQGWLERKAAIELERSR